MTFHLIINSHPHIYRNYNTTTPHPSAFNRLRCPLHNHEEALPPLPPPPHPQRGDYCTQDRAKLTPHERRSLLPPRLRSGMGMWEGRGDSSTLENEAACQPNPLASPDPCLASCIGDRQHTPQVCTEGNGEYLHAHAYPSLS